jgi:hypothetical protein
LVSCFLPSADPVVRDAFQSQLAVLTAQERKMVRTCLETLKVRHGDDFLEGDLDTAINALSE